MITLIDKNGYPVAVRTTGEDSQEECLKMLKWFNDDAQYCGLGRYYVEAVNQDGVRINEEEST